LADHVSTGDLVDRFVVQTDGDGVLIAAGELDLAAVPALRGALADRSRTIVDAAEVTFIDSSAVAVLLAAHRDRPETGLFLRAPSATVRRVLRLSGADQFLTTSA
jgi:anti-anti-sigma factor